MQSTPHRHHALTHSRCGCRRRCPMVTLFKTLDVSHLVRLSRKKDQVQYAYVLVHRPRRKRHRGVPHAARRRQTYALRHDRRKHYRRQPTGRGQLVRHPLLRTICDASSDDYMHLTRQVAETCANHDLAESMVIGTSALTQCEIDGAVGIVQRHLQQPISDMGQIPPPTFQDNAPYLFPVPPTQMDGAHAARFLDALQREITALKV